MPTGLSAPVAPSVSIYLPFFPVSRPGLTPLSPVLVPWAGVQCWEPARCTGDGGQASVGSHPGSASCLLCDHGRVPQVSGLCCGSCKMG